MVSERQVSGWSSSRSRPPPSDLSRKHATQATPSSVSLSARSAHPCSHYNTAAPQDKQPPLCTGAIALVLSLGFRSLFHLVRQLGVGCLLEQEY